MKKYHKYIALAENKDFRFIVSNTTEAGIAFNENVNAYKEARWGSDNLSDQEAMEMIFGD